MEAIVIALKEERKQALFLIHKYQKELRLLPKGSFFIRKLENKPYGYLTYSDKGVIKQDYLGALSPEIAKEWAMKMERKKKLRELLKKAKTQNLFLERALRYAGKKS